MEGILKRNESIDLLSLMNEFRSNGWMDKTTPVDISNLTSTNFTTESMVHAENLFLELENQLMFQRAMMIRNQIDVAVTSENLTLDRFHEILEIGKGIQFKRDDDEKNVELIHSVIDDTISAAKGEKTGLDLCYSLLSEKVLLENVDLMIIGARPAMGKTAFSVDLMVRLINNGKRVCFFSLEMSKKQIMRRIMANISGIDSNKIKFGNLTKNEFNRICELDQLPQLDNLKIYDGSHTINEIASKLNDSNFDVFIVDYLQKVTPKSTRSRYDSVTEISNGLKHICMNQKIPCVALAQLSRDSAKLGKRPSLPDLKESGEIEQDGSIVAFLHRPEYYGETETFNGDDATNICEFIVAKNREGETGIFEMKIDLATSRFKG